MKILAIIPIIAILALSGCGSLKVNIVFDYPEKVKQK